MVYASSFNFALAISSSSSICASSNVWFKRVRNLGKYTLSSEMMHEMLLNCIFLH